MMVSLLSRIAAGSLARRFALAAAALASAALIMIVVSSWWLVGQQHAAAMRLLVQKEADFHAGAVGGTLHAIDSRLSELADSSILATGLVDSVGKDLYLAPYLSSIQQINGVPIQILFTDFEGKEIATNGKVSFSAAQLAWLREQLQAGKENASVLPGAKGPELVAVELLRYNRTQSHEGAVLYKIALHDLRPNELAQVNWGPLKAQGPQSDGASGAKVTARIDAPPIYRHLSLRISETPSIKLTGLAPQYAVIFVIALILVAAVLIIGSRLALALTRDLRRLEAFSSSVIAGGFGAGRVDLSGSDEVASLGRSINHMLDRLNEQHTQLQHESEKLHHLANTIPQLAWMAHPDGRIHWYNDRWYAYTGTTSDQMREGDGWKRVHDPRLLSGLLRRMKEAIAAREPFHMTYPLRGADGEYRPFFMSAAPLRDASGQIVQWFGTHTDVSLLEKAERAARESEERLREGLVAARMMVWDWDLATGGIRLSANAADVIGFNPDQADDLLAAVHPDERPALQEQIVRAVADRSHFANVVRMIRPDNRDTIWVEVRGTVGGQGDGKASFIHGISLDVTERRRAEDALRVANRRKDEFLAMLAHELRNPLAPISTAAQLLRLGNLTQARMEELSEIVARQVDHMTSLVDDLLDVSRVTRGLVKLDMEVTDLRAVVEGAVEQVKSLIDARHHHLRVELDTDELHVKGDKTRLVQVIANLLSNSAKYTPNGGEILIRVRTAGRGNGGASAGELVELSVRDNGIGIAQELLPHVFELFTQAERSRDRSQGGLGLGLALVKSMVELHGGSVQAQSDGVGKGSCFTLCLPRIDATPPAPAREERRKALPAGGKALQVMVVDDNADAARSLALLLEARGYQVAIEFDALRALERASKEAPQVLLLDIGLPFMDGYELARRLRASPATARSLYIAVTGYGQQAEREMSKAAGFDHHFVKPADPAKLAVILSDYERALRRDESV